MNGNKDQGPQIDEDAMKKELEKQRDADPEGFDEKFGTDPDKQTVDPVPGNPADGAH